ncbi:MAG: hypothetical protein H6686_07260 [Fibrobacteria bacterium]|nr:hypothetical protein [Fibrobacteria bacterium]
MILVALALATTAAPPKFTSVYSDASTDSDQCKFDEEDEECQGCDTPATCPGPGGWSLVITWSGCCEMHGLSGPVRPENRNFGFGRCSNATFGKKVEWRLRDGIPIAAIHRTFCGEKDMNGDANENVGEYLEIEELAPPFRNEILDVRKVKNANVRAREIADNF